MAEAVCNGADITFAHVHLIRIDEEGLVDEAGWDMLAVADGIIFGCPTHMSEPPWQFKTVLRPHDSTLAHPTGRQTCRCVTPTPPGFPATGKTPNTPYIDSTKS
ncbi:hypothetical protein [Mycobacterium sp. URHB0021]|jgi:hypothetical protein